MKRVYLFLLLNAVAFSARAKDFIAVEKQVFSKVRLGNIGYNSPFHTPEITAMARDEEGKIFLAGHFNTLNGKKIGRGIIRLTSEGLPDPAFQSAGIFGGRVNAVLPDPWRPGGVFIGGNIINYQGSKRLVVRIKPDGSLDSDFGRAGDVQTVTSLLYDSKSDKIYVLGHFEEFSGQPFRMLVRLSRDGSLDETFKFDPNLILSELRPNSVMLRAYGLKMVLSHDKKKLYVAYCIEDGPNHTHRLARLTLDGLQDETFNPRAVDLFGHIDSIVEAHNGDVYIGGQIRVGSSKEESWQRGSLIRLHSDGELDLKFRFLGAEPDFGKSGRVDDIQLSDDGQSVYFASQALTGRVSEITFGKLALNGALENSIKLVGLGYDDHINTMVRGRAGEFYLGGLIRAYDNLEVTGLLRVKVGRE